MRSSRIPSLVLASEARRRVPQPWFRVTAGLGMEGLEIVSAQPVSWRWSEPCLSVPYRGADGEVVGRFENQNGRFKVARTGSGVSVVLDDLPLRADGC